MTARPSPLTRSLLWAAAALTGFAGNSLLARVALGGGHIDASTFTLVRLASGAATLAVLAGLFRSTVRQTPQSLASAVALFGYAAAFSFAYLQLGAGPGALILFGAVQATMIGWGLLRGERPGALTWAGLVLALAGLAALTPPSAPGSEREAGLLMALAGVAWGVYSLMGRGSTDPIGATAINFALSLPLAIGLSVFMLGRYDMSGRGFLLAATSGALASAVGYSFWYAALPALSATQAAVAQLLVPVLTAALAVVLLGEIVTPRLVASAAMILGGVVLALIASRRVRRQS